VLNVRAGFGGNFLGTLLVKDGAITPKQLEEALQYQNTKEGAKLLFGQILIQLGYCKEEDIFRVLAKQAGVAFISLETHSVDEVASSLISVENARRYKVLPIGFDNNRLIVAMRDPKDVIAVDDLRILTGYDIKPVIVPDRELESAINNLERMTSHIEQAATEEEAESETAASSEEASEKPAVQLANLILNQAVRAGASDVHIEPQEKDLRVRFRLDGVLRDIMHPPRQLQASLVSRIKVMANMDIAERRIPQDGRMTLKVEDKAVDVRVATLPAVYGEKMTLRLLDRSNQFLTLEQLGFPATELPKYQKIMRLPYGFILVTGPTGSGKTTTLYATLAVLNSIEKHIITVEDPVEYRLDGINQIQVNPKARMTFATALRSILRNDPDMIMIGEIRDQETARIAVESALTGHLVLSTLHTNDSAGAITRLDDMGIETFLTASSLIGVVAQRLLRLLCPQCKKAYTMKREEMLALIPDFPFDKGQEEVQLYGPTGCLRCSSTGYKGRSGVYELLLVSEKIQRMILERRPAREIKELAIAEGMITFRQDGLLKVKKGITSLEEVLRVVA
jgi:type IV pilus assembly protein PilB